MRPFFKNDDFNFLTEIALGSVYRQAADVGEVSRRSIADPGLIERPLPGETGWVTHLMV